ncbi:30745_t:CDS:1, partial [Racocetra persica]
RYENLDSKIETQSLRTRSQNRVLKSGTYELLPSPDTFPNKLFLLQFS